MVQSNQLQSSHIPAGILINTNRYQYEGTGIWYHRTRSLESIPDGDFGGLCALEKAARDREPHVPRTVLEKLEKLMAIVRYKEELATLVEGLSKEPENTSRLLKYLIPEIDLKPRIERAIDQAQNSMREQGREWTQELNVPK